MNGENTPSMVSTEDWRNHFNRLFEKFPKGKVLFRELSQVDDFYSTIEGKQELDNVRYNKAGHAKTVRATKTLEKYLERKSKRLKRQKLVIPDQQR